MLGESPASGEARVEISLSVAGLRPRYLETSETLSGRCRYRLRAFSPWLDPQSLIGEPTELRLFETGGRLRRIPARIETARLEMHAEDGAPELELGLTDPLALLASRRNTRLFLESSLVEIAATILGEHGIDPTRLDLRGSNPPVRAHRLQAFEDDWSFLSRLLIREGYCHALEGAGDDWRWVWCAPQSPDFGAARDPIPVIEPGAPLATSDGRGRAAFDFAGESVEHCPRRGSLRRLQLRGDVARLAPGCRFSLSGAAAMEEHTRVAWVAGEVNCRWDRDEERMRATVVAQPVDASLLQPEPRPPRVPEFFHARVESSGRFAEPDDEGRYRIRYGFDREDRPRAAASAPLSLISPYAGRDGAGWHFPLPPDGQLLLSTINGDPDQPLIVGHLSSLNDPGPVLGTEPGAHRIVSAGGQRLDLDDSPNRRHILLQTLDGRVYLALNADKPEQGPDHSVRMACAHGALRIQAGRQVGLRAGESLLHKAGKTWRSTVAQSARIEAGADIHERAPTAWFSDARGRFSLAADALSFRARAFEGRAARIRVAGRHMQLRTGEEARLRAQAPLMVKNTGQALWLGTEKAGFLLEGNRITIKARALSLEARTGIRRTGRHDRTSDSAGDTGAPRLESPASVPELESTGHEGNARIEACCWSGEAEADLNGDGDVGVFSHQWEQRRIPVGEALALSFHLSPAVTDRDITVRIVQDTASGKVALASTSVTGAETGVSNTARCPSGLKAGQAQALRILSLTEMAGSKFVVRGLGYEIESKDARARSRVLAEQVRDIELKVVNAHDQETPQPLVLSLEDANGAVHEAEVTNGTATLNEVPVGPFRLGGRWKTPEQGVAITATNGLAIPPGTLPWLIEEDEAVVCTRLEVQCLRPGILLNLREDADPEHPVAPARKRLSEEELEYFRAQGNATVVIHGYNVPLGAYGEQLESLQFGGDARELRLQKRWRPRNRHEDRLVRRVQPQETGAPVAIWREAEALKEAWPQGEAERPEDYMDDGYGRLWPEEPRLDGSLDPRARILNGGGAHGWTQSVEYHLNRAAGFDGEDYQPYTRVIGIAWQGDLGYTNFWDSEMAANRAGRALVPLLQQLSEAGIRVNVLTISLGARVILTAANLLAEMNATPIDQVLLWQPAVDQHALGDRPEDAGPLGHEAFPQAHAGIKRIVVLHSEGDGVLDPDFGVSNDGRPSDAIQNPMDTALGYLGGAYSRKYMLRRVDIREKYFGESVIGEALSNMEWARHHEAWKNRRPRKQDPLWRALKAEAEQLSGRLNPEQLDLLLPWAHWYQFTDERLERIHDWIWQVAVHDHLRTRGYVALGHRFPAQAPPSVQNLVDQQKLDEVNQTGILFSHSGMWRPSELLFQEVYVDQIWRQIRRYTAFGGY